MHTANRIKSLMYLTHMLLVCVWVTNQSKWQQEQIHCIPLFHDLTWSKTTSISHIDFKQQWLTMTKKYKFKTVFGICLYKVLGICQHTWKLETYFKSHADDLNVCHNLQYRPIHHTSYWVVHSWVGTHNTWVVYDIWQGCYKAIT